MLTVENVMRMLVCSRSSAYEHMNRALGRTERPGSLLRVPLDVFESYIVHTLRLAPPRARQATPSGGLSGSAATVPSASGAPAIRLAKAGKRAPETAHFYAKKAGALLRLFGEDFRLAQLDASAVDAYVRARRDEGTSDHTIHKELTTLRAALRLALRARLWSGSLDEVLPERFGAGYKPRERALTPDELSRLLGELTAPKAAAVAFMVATSANWRECTRARREDIDPESGWVHLRGTKSQTRDRRFVVAHPALLSLLLYAAEHAPGQDLLFPPWANVRRDLLEACARAGIERCSPNDLRRTYGRWMRIAAFPDELIAPTMGHADTRMLERVYGKLSPEELSHRLLLHARAALPDCIATASVGTEFAGISRQA